MDITKVTYLQQGEKRNTSSLIPIKVKTAKTKTNCVEILYNIKLQLLKQEKKTFRVSIDLLWKKNCTKSRIEDKHSFGGWHYWKF